MSKDQAFHLAASASIILLGAFGLTALACL